MNTTIERSFSVSADTHRGKSSILHFLEHFKRQRRGLWQPGASALGTLDKVLDRALAQSHNLEANLRCQRNGTEVWKLVGLWTGINVNNEEYAVRSKEIKSY